MSGFRFGVNLWSTGDRDTFVAKCRRIEELGYDLITVPDHLSGRWHAPFPTLAAAAMVTERVRIGTMVLNVPFYNPALLARDVIALIRTSGERFELGLGAGHMRSEFDDAGIPWRPAAERIGYLARAIPEIRQRLADAGVAQPPLLIAGNSDGVLELAAEHADIVGYAGLNQAPGRPPGTFQLALADELAERTEFVAQRAGDRRPERNMLIQHVEETSDPEGVAERWAADLPNRSELDTADLVAAPQLLVGTIDEMAATLVRHRERYGFGYFTVFEPFLEAFAPVIKALRAQ